jgi:uracil-DNA glycosylase
MLSQADAAALSTLAGGLPGVDTACYARHARDPRQPMLGLGPRDAPLCLVGRDPGDSEIAQWQPFVGPSGQKIRQALATHGEPGVFWINTVPFKPEGNKAWPLAVRRRFHAVLWPLLLREWDGRDVLTFGTEAFHWFALGQPDAVRQQVDAFWARDDRYEASLALQLDGRRLDLHPLPHPSPANAVWARQFPGLLNARLEKLLGTPGFPPAPE